MTEAREVPAVTLRGGVAMPMVGFGTWPLRARKACEAVRHALQAGYRHVDTATWAPTSWTCGWCTGRRAAGRA